MNYRSPFKGLSLFVLVFNLLSGCSSSSAPVAADSTPVSPNVSISRFPSSVADDSGTPVVYTVTLDQATTVDTSVNFALSGTATSGTDFAAVTSPLIIPAGETTGTISLTPITNTAIEDNKIAAITLRSGSGYTATTVESVTATITNNFTTGTYLYVDFDGSDFLTSTDQATWDLAAAPLTIINSTPSVPLHVVFSDFTGNITSAIQYIIAGSDNIYFGSQSLSSSGSPPATIVISNVANYPGFIRNTGNYNKIKVMNLSIKAIGTSTLLAGGGWVVQKNFASSGTENEVFNCQSNGPISTGGGGIVGNGSSNLTISGCISKGAIGTNAGGILGNNSSDITVSNSYSSGALDSGAGGIVGSATTDVTVDKSYSTGEIGAENDYNAGGIFATNSTTCIVTNSYSLGNIFGDNSGSNGGIVGGNDSDCDVSNSFSAGRIGRGSGGIFANGNTSSATNCYSMGAIAIEAGGIFGFNATTSTATNCYSTGEIGTEGGGIFGSNVTSSTATNSYSTGDIGTNAGGIFGANHINSIAENCYSSGESNSATDGIFSDSGGSGATTTDCFSEGTSSTGWDDSNANTVLTTASWISRVADTPFEFRNSAPLFNTPYSRIVGKDVGSGVLSLNNSFSQTIEKGQVTVSALGDYDAFSIHSINNASPSGFPEISIDFANGQISTTDDVEAGTYTIIVSYHSNSGLSGNFTSEFVLTINNDS